MTYYIPEYIKRSKVQDNNIHYKWDDWNWEQADEPIDDILYARLEGISARANIAFTISGLEWITFRFSRLFNDPIPFQFIEAAWAQIIDWRYGYAGEAILVEGEWVGPVKGPIGVAMRRVIFSMQEMIEYEGPELEASWIDNLVQYVMKDSVSYLKWRNWVLDNLEHQYPRDPKEIRGEVVPKQTLNPDSEFDISQTEALINDYLNNLDYNSNPYLNSPDEMIRLGYNGVPYVFNIEQDRKDRFEW